MRLALAALALPFLSGCALILHGSRQNVLIETDPPGATITVNGVLVGKTPMKVPLKRADPGHVVVEKDGISENILFDRHLDEGWFVWDLIFTLGIGIPIDFFTGSMIVVEKPKEKPRLRLN
jgi:hypothetical protein